MYLELCFQFPFQLLNLYAVWSQTKPQCAALTKWCWHRKTEVQAGCLVQSSSIAPKTKHGLIWYRILTSSMKRYTITSTTMAKPLDLFFIANGEEKKFPIDQSMTEPVISISQCRAYIKNVTNTQPEETWKFEEKLTDTWGNESWDMYQLMKPEAIRKQLTSSLLHSITG